LPFGRQLRSEDVGYQGGMGINSEDMNVEGSKLYGGVESAVATLSDLITTQPVSSWAPNKIYGATSITSDGSFVYVKTNGLPDHKSAYYNTSNVLYESFSGTTFKGTNFSKEPQHNCISEFYLQDSNRSI